MKHDQNIKADQFAVAPRDLQKAVEFVNQAINRRGTIPVLSMMRLTVKAGLMTLQATDLDNDCETTVAGAGSFEFDILTSPALMLTALKCSDTPATFEKLTGGDIEFKTGAVSYMVTGAPPVEDMPKRYEHDGATFKFEIDEADLRRALAITIDFVSKEETRYYLNGVLFTAGEYGADPDDDGSSLRLVATDGHRLAAMDTDACAPKDIMSILRMDACAMLIKALKAKGSATIKVSASDRLMRFDTPAGVIGSKLIDGSYPDYRRVIPEADTFAVRLTRAEIKALYLRSASNGCEINPAEGVITQRLWEVHGQLQWRVAIEKNDHPPFGFNGNYLRVFAKHFAEFGVWSVNGEPGSPFLITGDDDRATFVLMPMRV